MFTVASRFRRLNFVGSDLSTIEAVGTGSWLSVVQVLLDVSIALLVAIIEFHGGIHRGYRTISSEFFFVKRYMQSHLKWYRLIGLESGSFLLRHYGITKRWAKVFLKALVERNSVMVVLFYMILISQKYDQKRTILKG